MKKIDLIAKIANRCGDNIELSDVKEWFDGCCSNNKTVYNDCTTTFSSSRTFNFPDLTIKIPQKIVHRISIETDKLVLYESGRHDSKIGSLPYGVLEEYSTHFVKGEEFFKDYKLANNIEVCHSEAISGGSCNVHRLPNLLTILVKMGYKIDSIPSAQHDFKFIHMTKPVL